MAMFLNTVKRNTVQGYLRPAPTSTFLTGLPRPTTAAPSRSFGSFPAPPAPGPSCSARRAGSLADDLPSGCPLCAPLMLGAIMGYNFTRDSAILEEAARSWCPCQAEWERSLEEEAPPMKERLSIGISFLEAAFGHARPNRRAVRLPNPIMRHFGR